MSRPAFMGLIATAVCWPALLVAQGDLACGPSEAKDRGVLGIGWYHCVGGQCRLSDTPGERWYRLSSEPRLREVEPNGPAAAAGVRSGDVLAAIDRTPITAAEGGRRLGNLRPGQSVTFTLRRDGRLFDVSVTPVAGCRMPGLAVTNSDRWPMQWSLKTKLMARAGRGSNAASDDDARIESGTEVSGDRRLSVRRGGAGGRDDGNGAGVGSGIGAGVAGGNGAGVWSGRGGGTSVAGVGAGAGAGAAAGIGAGAGADVRDDAISVAAPVRAKERVGNIGVTVSGAPIRWHRDPATGDYVITTSTNTIRLSPPRP